MMKLKIFNMKEFLKVVDTCTGAVNVVYSDGKKVNINKDYEAQGRLWDTYLDNKKCAKISLDIVNPKDYFSIVSYYAGDC